MAGLTQIDLKRQSEDGTLNHEKLETDFLNGADLDITGGNNNATITGLANGVNPRDAVTKAQLDAIVVSGGMTYQGTLDASDPTGVALDGASKGDFFYISVAGTLDGIAFNVGDHLVVNDDITDFSVDGAGKIDIIDNTESSDILRDSDIQNNLTTTVAGDVLDATQGKILKDLIDALGTDVYGEAPVVTGGSPVLPALANIPVLAGTARVYLNGLRQYEGGGNDYTINEATGVITFNFNLKNPKDTVLVDYKY